MGKELSMARSEDTEQSMLLASSGPGVSLLTSSGGDKRKKASSTINKEKGRKAKATSAKSKARAKVEDSDGSASRRKGPRQHDKNRKSNRGAEGTDTTPRRCASELGVEWIGSYCPDGQPHFLIGSRASDGWSMFRCRECGKHLLLPADLRNAVELEHIMKRYGATAGYCKYLDRYRNAKVLIAKMQDLWRAKQQIDDNVQLIGLIVKVMEDKEYDRKEV